MRSIIFFLVIFIFCFQFSRAQIPKTISYQGILSEADVKVDGDKIFTFKLYEAETGGEAIWSEVRVLNVKDGVFNAVLGQESALNLPFDKQYWLGVKIASGDELSPRIPLTSSAYSLNAQSVVDGAVVKSINNLKDRVSLLEGDNITIISSDSTITISAASGAAADDDWQVNGANIYRENGNVGIGTTDPLYKLHAITSVDSIAIFGKVNESNIGKYNYGVIGEATRTMAGIEHINYGVYGLASGAKMGNYDECIGIYGKAEHGGLNIGLYGYSKSEYDNFSCYGVYAKAEGSGYDAYGIYASASGGGLSTYGVYSYAESGANSLAAYFAGDVEISGSLSKGAGSFKIDHPLDPENKYLLHSFVESPDMMNIYNGNVILDSNGEAWVELPKWFEALNKDFRYQLTCIGGYAQVYISEKVNGNRFKIAGGSNGLEVSWQVTGIRQDPFAEKNRIKVEQDKKGHEIGKYIHPRAYGLPETMSINYERHRRNDEMHNRIKK